MIIPDTLIAIIASASAILMGYALRCSQNRSDRQAEQIAQLKAELRLWKPRKDARGRFIKKG